MAVTDVSAYIARATRLSFNGVLIEGAQSISGLGPTGSVPEIDVSDMSSPARLFEAGIPDPGTASAQILLDPSTPGYAALKDSSSSGSIHEIRLIVGAKPTTSNYTDGSPIVTATFPAASGPAAPTGITAAAGKLTVAKAQASSLKGTKPGHFIQSGSNFGTSTKITGVTVLTSGNVELAHAGSAITIGTAAVRIVKPAWEVRRLAYVSGFAHDFNIDAAIATPVEFRLSGEGETNVGDPAITV